MLDKLKPIDKFSFSYFSKNIYKQFVKDKKAKMNYYGYKYWK